MKYAFFFMLMVNFFLAGCATTRCRTSGAPSVRGQQRLGSAGSDVCDGWVTRYELRRLLSPPSAVILTGPEVALHFRRLTPVGAGDGNTYIVG